MQMTISKKVVAVILALLMIFSTMSVAGFAYDYDEDNPPAGTLTLITKIFKQVDGEWVEASTEAGGTTVAPGDDVQVRVYAGTDFYTTGLDILFYYDNCFFSTNYAEKRATALTVNPDMASAWSAYVAPKAAVADEGMLMVAAALKDIRANAVQLSADNYLFVMDMKVAATATSDDVAGSVYAKASDLASIDNDEGETTATFGDATDNSVTIVDGFSCNLTADFTAAEEVTIANTVTFKAGYDEGTDATVNGTVGAEAEIPAITRDGYTFLGWESNNDDVAAPAKDDATFTMPYETGVEFTALWEENVTIKFDVDGGSAIADITGVYGGQEWTNQPTTTKDGYKFMGWSGKDVVDGALPSTYPMAADGINEYTYTANWKKYVTITYVSNGETIKTITTVPNLEVYDGAAWDDTEATPKYSKAADYTVGGNYVDSRLVRPGYAFKGWQDQNGVKYTEMPATYPAEDTVYTAIWQATTVEIEYYFDNNAAIQVDGSVDADAAAAIISQGNMVAADSVTYGENYTVPAVSVNGKEITTWFLVLDDGSVVTYTAGSTVPVVDAAGTLKAVASATELSEAGNLVATFNANGGKFADDTSSKVITGLQPFDVINAPADPTRDGYTFVGWDQDVYAIGDENLTFTAVWNANSYSVIAMNDGEVYETIDVAYGAEVDVPDAPEKEGYTFVAWCATADCADTHVHTVPSIMPAEDVTIYAVWEVNEYTVTYIVDEEVYETFDVVYGAEVDTPEEPEKEGYTFAGWDPEVPATMPAEDIELVAQWTINEYTITFVDEDDEEIGTLTTEYNAAIEEADYADIEAPVKEGYTFAGWDPEVPATMPAEDTTVKATYTINNHVLTFVYANDVDVDTVYEAVDYATALDSMVPADPTRTGYVFDGWEDADGKAPADYTAGMPDEDVTFTAQWSKDSFTITYVLDNGEEDIVRTYEYQEATEAAPTVTKTGFTFDSWSADTPAAMPAENLTITANWNRNDYTITYKFDNGDADSVVTYAYEATVETPAAPEKEGYTFAGWDKEIPATMPAENVEITAQWTINSYDITYIVDGVQYEKETYEFGAEVTPVEAPTKAGYTFSGWSAIPETMPATDVEIRGNFTADEQTITYIVDGEEDTTRSTTGLTDDAFNLASAPTKDGYTFSGWTVKDADGNVYGGNTIPAGGLTITGSFSADGQPVVYKVDGVVVEELSGNPEINSEFVLAADRVKEGYTFSGWTVLDADGNEIEVPATVPLGGLTIEGSFTVNKYTITYVVDGEEFFKDVKDYGAAITAPEAPTKDGYTFSGWDNVPATMPVDGATVTGTFIADDQTITYIVDGETYTTETYKTDAAITPVAEPTKAGYTFSGWSEIPATMPAGGVTVEGTFAPDDQTITYYVDGEVYTTETYKTDATVVPVAAPTKAGYTFSGWSEIPATMPATEVTVTGTFKADDQTITYYVDGKVYTTETYKTDAEVTPVTAPTKAGYTFSGWDNVPATMPAGGAVVNGTFSADDQEIIYYVDGVEYTKETYKTDAAITPVAAPTKAGYTFSGWSEIPATMPADGATVEGTFTADPQPITFVVTGTTPDGYTKPADTTAVTDSEFSVPVNPTVAGYTFGGWIATNENGESVAVVDGKVIVPAGGLTLTMNVTVGDYTITYMANGTTFDTKSFNTDADIVAPATNPSKAGYSFTGWTYAAENGDAYTGTTMPAFNLVATAQFETVAQTLTIVNDGEESTTEVNTDATFTLPEVAEKPGYSTDGWVVTATEGGATIAPVDGAYTMPAGGATATLTYTADDQTITYVVDGETYKTETYKTDATITPVAEPTKAGYTFSGWSEIPATMPAGGATVTGTFTADDQEIVYYVDGEEYTRETYKTDAAITPVAAPTKDGYTFSGWSEIPVTMPAGGATVTGTFTADDQEIVYYVDGAEFAKETYKTDAAITAIDEPTKAGYTFSGWSEIPATMPAGGATVTGTFAADDQTITYYVDGEVYTSETYKTDAEVTPVAEPTKDGYTFSGWSEIPETMPATSVTVTGTFTADDQTITYIVDGETYTTETYKTDAEITPVVEPTKDGYTFSGWSEIPATMPAGGVTVTGTFTADDQEIVYYVDGVEYAKETYKTDAAITAVEEPTKAGYTFSGWDNVPATMPAGGAVVNGTFTADDQTITYYVDGEVYTTETYKTDEAITPVTEPTKAGYTFSGWSEIPATMPADGATVEGTFTADDQEIVYYVDGEEYTRETYKTDEAITPVTEPTKDGYDFSGWSEIPATMPAGGVTVEGTFTEHTYQIVVKDADGNPIVDDNGNEIVVDYTYGDDADDIAVVTPEEKEGYVFENWTYVDEDGNEYEYDSLGELIADVKPTSDEITVTPNYRVDELMVTFIVDGVEYEAWTVAYGEEIDVPEEPEKDGYVFEKWVDENGVELDDAYGTMPAHNITFTACWTTLIKIIDTTTEPATEYVIEVPAGEPLTQEMVDEAGIVDPEKEGYDFIGWTYTTDDGDEIVVDTDSIAELFNSADDVSAIVLTPKFEKADPDEYTVTFVAFGEEIDSLGVYEGEEIDLVEAPDYEGYEFIAWCSTEDCDAETHEHAIPDVMPANDITIYAVYKLSTVDVEFYDGDELVKTSTIMIGDALTADDMPADPEKENYIFTGWADAEGNAYAVDTVVDGTTTVQLYAQ